MKKNYFVVVAFCGAILLSSCGGNEANETTAGEGAEAPKSMVSDPSSYDPKRGEGKFNAENTTTGPLDAAMAVKGEAIANTKCFSCHKMTEEKLVGPGWKGVSTRRAPYWILNFITNPDPMIDKDPEVQAQLELCLVRMPNQNLMEGDARQVLEFMRKNDGAK